MSEMPVLEYECPRCGRWAEWTDGTMADEDAETIDEYWCQTCGNEVALAVCPCRPQHPMSEESGE